MPELRIVSDHIFVKTKAGALTSEAFSEFIRSKDIREFYITGADAAGCVKSTCFNMTKADNAVHVVAGCVTGYDLPAARTGAAKSKRRRSARSQIK